MNYLFSQVQFGVAAGRIIVTYQDHNSRIKRWIVWGVVTVSYGSIVIFYWMLLFTFVVRLEIFHCYVHFYNVFQSFCKKYSVQSKFQKCCIWKDRVVEMITWIEITEKGFEYFSRKMICNKYRLYSQGILAGCFCGWRKEGGLIPVNKNLWSLSYVLTTACFAFLLLSFFYVVIDKWQWWSGNPLRYAG